MQPPVNSDSTHQTSTQESVTTLSRKEHKKQAVIVGHSKKERKNGIGKKSTAAVHMDYAQHIP